VCVKFIKTYDVVGKEGRSNLLRE